MPGWRSAWHRVQAFGLPSAIDRSGRGTRMPWSRRAIHHHVRLRGHVALDALRALAFPPCGSGACPASNAAALVAARAQGVALGAQLSACGVVAVHAGDAALVHLALQERAPDVDLLALLTVGVVVRRGRAGRGGACPRAARRAGRSRRRSSAGRGRPRTRSSARRAAGWSRCAVFASGGGNFHASFQRLFRTSSPLSARPSEYRGLGFCAHSTWREPGPWQASQATLISLKRRLVRVGGRVVALLQVGRVARGALQVPVLVQAGPVERIACGRSSRSDRRWNQRCPPSFSPARPRRWPSAW